MTKLDHAYLYCASIVFGFAAGVCTMDVAVERQRAAEAAKPKRLEIRPAQLQLSCNKQDVREYIHACAARVRMGAVGNDR